MPSAVAKQLLSDWPKVNLVSWCKLLATIGEALREECRTRPAHFSSSYQDLANIHTTRYCMGKTSFHGIIYICFLSVRLKAILRGVPSNRALVACSLICIRQAGPHVCGDKGSRLQIKFNRHHFLPLIVTRWRELQWSVGGGDCLYSYADKMP